MKVSRPAKSSRHESRLLVPLPPLFLALCTANGENVVLSARNRATNGSALHAGAVAPRLAADLPRCVPLTVMLVAVMVVVAWGETPSASPAVPTPQQLKSVVDRHFASVPDYEPGDLITQTPTKQLLQKMQQKGWIVDNAQEILESVLPDDDILVQQFQTKKGREFWDKIRGLSGGIDRLDRLARMPQGQANVRDMIQKIPDGHKWIEAMTTTERGRRLGDRLSKTPSGQSFNKPTSRIYTADDLVGRMVGHVLVATPAPTR